MTMRLSRLVYSYKNWQPANLCKPVVTDYTTVTATKRQTYQATVTAFLRRN